VQLSKHFLSERSGKFVQWFDGFRQIHRENHGVQLINGEFAQSDYTIRVWNLSSGSWLPTSPAGKAAAFTIWVGEDESQRGNAVDLLLGGVPLGRFLIEQNRYALPSLKERGNRFDWRSSAQRVQTGERFPS